MRLFFALWPDETERAALAAATRDALLAAGGRAVPQESWHVTLAFLGSVPVERLPELRAAASGVRAEPFDLVLEHVECFRRARVLVATPAEAPRAAESLAAQLRERLTAAKVEPGREPFRAHLTLARGVVRGAEGEGLRMAPVALRCASFALVESRTERAGALYSVLESWPLYGGRNT